ncbi:hypothetical protein OG225_42805 (plasmid) [Nocardia sp. NBC_01377]|uniref:hypothetical protein n=1 Tax=Nocardia sp. NBC_01377 TaxID=2903595 RepID=UPI002F914899
MSTTSEQWRRWLQDPAVVRDESTPVAVGRRGRARRARDVHSGAATSPRNSGGGRRIVVVALIAGVSGAGLAAVALTSADETGRHPAAHPYAVITPSTSVAVAATTSAGPPPFCSPGTVGATVVTNSAGDRATGQGVIAAYEHAFFVARDPRAALDVTDRGPGLPAEPQLAQGIAAVPVGAPWCVSITDMGGGLFETAVRHQPQGQPPVLWLLNINVADQGGLHTIVRIEDKAG